MLKSLATKAKNFLLPFDSQSTTQANGSAVAQIALSMQYRQLLLANQLPLNFKDVGFKIHSQHEEDGIILFIFALIGSKNKKCVEICAGDGIESVSYTHLTLPTT